MLMPKQWFSLAMRQEQRSKKEVIMSQKQRYKDHPAGFAPVLDCSKQRGAFYLSHHQCAFLHLTLNLAYAETCYLQLVRTFCVKMQLCRLRKKKENKFFRLGKNRHHHVTTRQRQRLSIQRTRDAASQAIQIYNRWYM